MMTSRGFFSYWTNAAANAGSAGIRGVSSSVDRMRQTEAILRSSAVAVAQLVEHLVQPRKVLRTFRGIGLPRHTPLS